MAALFALALAALAGCSLLAPVPQMRPVPWATAPPLPPRRPAAPASAYWIITPFDETEFAPYAGYGTSAIAGEAFWRTPDGGVILAANREVVLVPDTAYTRELLGPARSSRYSRVANFDPRYFRYRKTAIADGRGNFRFNGLLAGSYILQTSVKVPKPARYHLRRDTIFLHQQVRVDPAATANVIVTR